MLIHKTMKMPTSCLSCWIAPTCEVWVREKSKYKGYDDRLENCPLEEVKHGHWIEANDISSSPFDAMKRCLCSECREWGVVTNYCPNCGAKMDEVEDETNWTPPKRMCNKEGIMCEFATEFGYCKITGCVHRTINYSVQDGGKDEID